MPSIYTHDYFAVDTYKKLEKEKIYQINDKTFYKIFAQSFDTLFYYNSFKLKLGKEYRKLGHYAHKHKTWEYFKNILEYIKKNKLYNDENLGYLYGSILHYSLDSTCHPYIHYISGRLDRNNLEDTRKYTGMHAVNEIMLDAIYYYKDHDDKYYKYKLYKDIIPKVEFPTDLKKTIDYAFKNTFDKDNIGEIFNNSYKQVHYIYKYLMYDRTSIKKKIYKFVDFITPRKLFKAYSYSHHINKANYNLLNLNHSTWLHPVTGEKHTESFEDLFKIAQDKAIKRIKKCNDYFKGKCKITDVEKIMENISYSSGLDCDIRVEFKYFKY